MVLLDLPTKAFRTILNIGITPDIRPEEVKHIQYLNTGYLLVVVINLTFFVQGLVTEKIPLIMCVGYLSVGILGLLVFVLNFLGQYTTARIYGFLLFYASCIFVHTLSGKDMVDHYVIFVAIGYVSLVFPKQEKRLMAAMIITGVMCYIAILVLYQYVEPVLQLDRSILDGANRVFLYITIVAFIILMMSGKYFTDQMEDNLLEEREKLAEMSDLLKKMFGRYLSTEVMNSLIENPSALELGGEKRSVTIMMSDLRGFTALAERLEPEQVLKMLNTYFEVMVDIILKYNGTINEIIGDALLIIFGAPQEMPDRAQRAIACAIEMQNAMVGVNDQNRAEGLPDLEMGIGLNETDVIVGNIGSSQRSKYAVVGSGVNITSRIESYSVGGQILVSESIRQEAGDVLRIDNQRDVFPKGAKTALRIYEIGGITGDYNLALEGQRPDLVALTRQIPIGYSVLDGKHEGKKKLQGSVIRLSKQCAEITTEAPLEIMTNLRMNLVDVDEKLSAKDFFGKMIKCIQDKEQLHLIHFTSVPPEIDAYFHAYRQHSS